MSNYSLSANLPSLEYCGISESHPYTHTCFIIGNETMRVSPIEADTGETHTEPDDNDIFFPFWPKKMASSQAKYTTATKNQKSATSIGSSKTNMDNGV